METKVSVKEIVKDTIAKFDYASCGKIYYKIIGENNTFIFPINLNDTDDVGTTRFEPEYKSITLMRYVNKAIKHDELVIYPTVK